MGNLKGNKPSIMVAKFADFATAEEAKKRGVEYARPPSFTFLILENGGQGTPITLKAIQKMVDKPGTSSSLAEGGSMSLQLQQATVLLHYDSDEEAEDGEKVRGVRLNGHTRLWWDELTRVLQPENWTETMVFYVEHLISKVECAGVKMDALRIRRHFATGEVEET